jgi:hypothetical protein
MLYLKINENIKSLIELIKDSFKLGCKEYCPHQLIALDEFELLRKELEFKNLKSFTDEEYKDITKSTETVYLHTTHLCSSSDTSTSNKKLESHVETDSDTETEQRLLEELKKDKISNSLNKNRKNYFDSSSRDIFEEEYQNKKDEEEKNKNKTKSEIQKIRTEGSLSYAFSMIASFFLLVLGSYYLGKYFFGMSDSNTYKLVLVITIIVLLSEMFLFLIKMNKDSEKILTPGKIMETSFAYKFNKQYRDIVTSAMRKKKVFDKVKKE